MEAKSARFLSRMAVLIDRRPELVLPVWIAAYFSVLWAPARRPLWYDELFSYYVSMSPSWERFAGCILHVDLNPPLSYLFVRASIVLFGDSPFVTRLPSMLSFLVASLILWRLVTRRLGGALGLAALGILWSFSFTELAAEARPYGLLLALFSIALLCWLNAIEATHWTKWHTGLAAAIVGMLLTHCFSPVCVAAIGVGELARTIALKRIDKRILGALLCPMTLALLYIPLVKNAQSFSMPHVYDATLWTVPMFYLTIILPALPAIALMPLFWVAGRAKETASRAAPDRARPYEIAFSVAALVLPNVIIVYCIWSGVSFWPRYGIGAALGGTLALTALLAKATKRNVNASAAAAALILLLFCFTKAGTQLSLKPYGNATTAYRTVRPELPFVAACGLTFLEMDHLESPEFARRLHYLTDMDSAGRYVHATGFEGLPVMQRWVPIRGNVSPYHDFIKQNKRFLVLATPGCPFEWLLLKLNDDGAQIRLIQDSPTGYRDHELYEITVRP